MKKLLLIMVPLFLTMGLFVFATDHEIEKEGFMRDKKMLVVYFSWGGHTKLLAEKIHSKVGGNMFAIEPASPYPTDYHETAYGIAKTQNEQGIHPDIKNTEDVSDYDVVFLGTPVWWYTMAPPVMTFLEKNNFEGKTIVPFITHGGGGQYNIQADIGKLAKGAEVLEPFVVYEGGDSETDKEMDKWIKNLN